jgi:hypothetical protein
MSLQGLPLVAPCPPQGFSPTQRDSTPREALAALAGADGQDFVCVSPAGHFLPRGRPWEAPPLAGADALAGNAYVLELLHERLLRSYDRIDFDRIRRGLRKAPQAEDLEDEAVALSCQDLAGSEAAAPGGGADAPAEARPSAPRRVRPPLRAARLLGVLERLGCEVRQGKGSEVTVFRAGGRQFTLGHHGQNPEVRWPVVKRLLSRVGVAPGEWSRAVYGS